MSPITLIEYLSSLILCSQIQARIQEELDAVVGGGSQVTLDHKLSLPLTEATLFEVWRLGPVAPIAPSRYCEEDTWIGDCFIGKGNE